MKVKKYDYEMLSLPKRTKDMLDVLRFGGKLSYAKVLDYLLIKSGHMEPKNSLYNYIAIDNFINGEINE